MEMRGERWREKMGKGRRVRERGEGRGGEKGEGTCG